VTRRSFLASAAAAAAAPAARCTMGLSPDCFVLAGPRLPPLEYLEYAYARGAGGVQVHLPPDPTREFLAQLRAAAERRGMYLEVSLPLDPATFESTARAAREAGAHCLRSVCLSGRRYENFSTLAEWQAFVAQSHARLAAVVPILDRVRMPMGLENHKDWTIQEMVPLLKSYSSEYLGVCLDWGNNLALLENPVEVAAALAPYTVNSHIKDMAVEESETGFNMSEVALGRGILPLEQILATIRQARPKARFSLDMLTRNSLSIPCLTDKYWATMPTRSATHLARALSYVRAHRPANPLTRLDNLPQPARLELEQQNVRESIEYAREQLGLRS
jgi:sugar phosphate isomerase/epimerase